MGMRDKLRNWDWYIHPTAAAKSLQSCPTLCDPTDGSPPGSPVPGILQARTLEWVAISFSNAWKWKNKVTCPTPSNPMDCSAPGPSIHGIFQTRVLEWVAIAFSDIHPTIYKIDNWKELQYASQNSIHCFVMTYMEQESKKRVDICITKSFCCSPETNTL